jgi:hypothetical protein
MFRRKVIDHSICGRVIGDKGKVPRRNRAPDVLPDVVVCRSSGCRWPGAGWLRQRQIIAVPVKAMPGAAMREKQVSAAAESVRQ